MIYDKESRVYAFPTPLSTFLRPSLFFYYILLNIRSFFIIYFWLEYHTIKRSVFCGCEMHFPCPVEKSSNKRIFQFSLVRLLRRIFNIFLQNEKAKYTRHSFLVVAFDFIINLRRSTNFRREISRTRIW